MVRDDGSPVTSWRRVDHLFLGGVVSGRGGERVTSYLVELLWSFCRPFVEAARERWVGRQLLGGVVSGVGGEWVTCYLVEVGGK